MPNQITKQKGELFIGIKVLKNYHNQDERIKHIKELIETLSVQDAVRIIGQLNAQLSKSSTGWFSKGYLRLAYTNNPDHVLEFKRKNWFQMLLHWNSNAETRMAVRILIEKLEAEYEITGALKTYFAPRRVPSWTNEQDVEIAMIKHHFISCMNIRKTNISGNSLAQELTQGHSHKINNLSSWRVHGSDDDHVDNQGNNSLFSMSSIVGSNDNCSMKDERDKEGVLKFTNEKYQEIPLPILPLDASEAINSDSRRDETIQQKVTLSAEDLLTQGKYVNQHTQSPNNLDVTPAFQDQPQALPHVSSVEISSLLQSEAQAIQKDITLAGDENTPKNEAGGGSTQVLESTDDQIPLLEGYTIKSDSWILGPDLPLKAEKPDLPLKAEKPDLHLKAKKTIDGKQKDQFMAELKKSEVKLTLNVRRCLQRNNVQLINCLSEKTAHTSSDHEKMNALIMHQLPSQLITSLKCLLNQSWVHASIGMEKIWVDQKYVKIGILAPWDPARIKEEELYNAHPERLKSNPTCYDHPALALGKGVGFENDWYSAGITLLMTYLIHTQSEKTSKAFSDDLVANLKDLQEGKKSYIEAKSNVENIINRYFQIDTTSPQCVRCAYRLVNQSLAIDEKGNPSTLTTKDQEELLTILNELKKQVLLEASHSLLAEQEDTIVIRVRQSHRSQSKETTPLIPHQQSLSMPLEEVNVLPLESKETTPLLSKAPKKNRRTKLPQKNSSAQPHGGRRWLRSRANKLAKGVGSKLKTIVQTFRSREQVAPLVEQEDTIVSEEIQSHRSQSKETTPLIPHQQSLSMPLEEVNVLPLESKETTPLLSKAPKKNRRTKLPQKNSSAQPHGGRRWLRSRANKLAKGVGSKLKTIVQISRPKEKVAPLVEQEDAIVSEEIQSHRSQPKEATPLIPHQQSLSMPLEEVNVLPLESKETTPLLSKAPKKNRRTKLPQKNSSAQPHGRRRWLRFRANKLAKGVGSKLKTIVQISRPKEKVAPLVDDVVMQKVVSQFNTRAKYLKSKSKVLGTKVSSVSTQILDNLEYLRKRQDAGMRNSATARPGRQSLRSSSKIMPLETPRTRTREGQQFLRSVGNAMVKGVKTLVKGVSLRRSQSSETIPLISDDKSLSMNQEGKPSSIRFKQDNLTIQNLGFRDSE